jgi:tRNA pseudouridine32 synthase/23S rRNA pseudouridine746 synthase
MTDEQLRWALDDLARDSRADTVAERQLSRQHRLEREPFVKVLRDLDQQQAAIRRAQAARSCQLREQLYAGYRIDSARGERRSLPELFAPATPPGGSADCAAPKLFAHALREGLRPLALAEFWVGTPSSAGGRHGGTYHPACQTKCGPVLEHMLDGLIVDRSFAGRPTGDERGMT